VGAEPLIGEACQLEQKRSKAPEAGNTRHREQITKQQHRWLPNCPGGLLWCHFQCLVSERVEVLRMPESVCIPHADENPGGITARQIRGIVGEHLLVGPLGVRRFACDLTWSANRVKSCEHICEQVLGLLDQSLSLF